MNLAFSTENSFYDDCFDYTEKASIRLLETTSNTGGLCVVNYDPKEDLSYDHWVCSIVVALGEAKVYVEAHFASKTARKVAARALGMEEQKISSSVLIDFMREYLNRIMGDIKDRYQSTEEQVSLPQVTPSYDRGVVQQEEYGLNHRNWKICWSEGQIVLGCYAVSTGDVTNLFVKDTADTDTADDDSNIDFF